MCLSSGNGMWLVGVRNACVSDAINCHAVFVSAPHSLSPATFSSVKPNHQSGFKTGSPCFDVKAT